LDGAAAGVASGAVGKARRRVLPVVPIFDPPVARLVVDPDAAISAGSDLSA
jgi:hypothetical protein